MNLTDEQKPWNDLVDMMSREHVPDLSDLDDHDVLIGDLYNTRNLMAVFALDPSGGPPANVCCKKCHAHLPATANTREVLAAGGVRRITTKIEIPCKCGATRILHPGR